MFHSPVTLSSCLCPCHLHSKGWDKLQNQSFVLSREHLRWRQRSFLSPMAAPQKPFSCLCWERSNAESSFLQAESSRDWPSFLLLSEKTLLSLSFTLIWTEGRNPSSGGGCCGLSFTATPSSGAAKLWPKQWAWIFHMMEQEELSASAPHPTFSLDSSLPGWFLGC